MKKTYVIAICIGLFLQVAANAKHASTGLWNDTSSLRNSRVATSPSLTSNDLAHDAPEAGLAHASPISLTLFKVALNYERVLIDWSTAEERNNKFFTIDRSDDGINFNYLGFLIAGSDPSAQNDYRIIDQSPKEGLNYYRLSQTDRNGRISYFGTRIINYKNSKDFSAGVINISNGNINMIINSSKKDDLTLNLVDIYGKEIIRESFTVATGSTSKTFLMQKGTYVAVLSNKAGEKAINKILVQ